MKVGRKTTEQFIQDAMLIHGNQYDYSLVEYINAKTKVSIICKTHGVFKQNPSNHTNIGHGCKKCEIDNRRINVDDFILKANVVHNYKYEYSKVLYENTHNKVTIICPIHGEFNMKPNSHVSNKQGCPKCANKHKTLEDFIVASNIIHNNKYDYSKFKYINSHTKSTILCPIHGEFEQTPACHQYGQGCGECGYNNHTGRYSDSYFSMYPNRKNDSATLYVWEIYNDIELFIKVGITTTSVKQRIRNNKTTEYKINSIIEVELPLIIAYNKEQEILQQFNTFQYVPRLSFQGKTECLLLECKNTIINIVTEIQNEQQK